MIYHSFPALSRYCPSNYGPCGNHMTLYINLKQQEDKGVIYTRGRDGEHHHNEDAPKQDTGTFSPARLTLTKPTALWDIWARQCKKSQSVFFFFFFQSPAAISGGKRCWFLPPCDEWPSLSISARTSHLSVTWRQTITRLATTTPGAALDGEVWAERRMPGQ